MAALIAAVLLCSWRLLSWLRQKGWQRPFDDELELREKRTRSVGKRSWRAVEKKRAEDIEEITTKTRKGKAQGRWAEAKANELSKINIDADFELHAQLPQRAKATRKGGRRGWRNAEIEQVCSSESDSARYDREPLQPQRRAKTTTRKGSKRGPALLLTHVPRPSVQRMAL